METRTRETRTRPWRLLLLALALAGGSCGGFMPGSFWDGHRSELIVHRTNDQGPWGGARCIHWESSRPEEFAEADVLAFATDHGWTLRQRTELTSAELAAWRDRDGQEAFLLLTAHIFPRHIVRDAILLEFESGMLREDPGVNTMHPALGYVLLGADGRRMALFDFWGNG